MTAGWLALFAGITAGWLAVMWRQVDSTRHSTTPAGRAGSGLGLGPLRSTALPPSFSPGQHLLGHTHPAQAGDGVRVAPAIARRAGVELENAGASDAPVPTPALVHVPALQRVDAPHELAHIPRRAHAAGLGPERLNAALITAPPGSGGALGRAPRRGYRLGCRAARTAGTTRSLRGTPGRGQVARGRASRPAPRARRGTRPRDLDTI